MTTLRAAHGDTLTLDIGPVVDRAGIVQDITGATLRFTAKARAADLDADAILTGSTIDGRIAVTNGPGGLARVTIPSTAMAAIVLSASGTAVLLWDVQLTLSSLVKTLDAGSLIVSQDITRTAP